MLDIEVIGAIVPKATIVVYFSPNLTDADFSDAVLAAVHDTVNKPSVISISWGGPEDEATGQFLDAFKTALEDAQSLNITVLVASGDNGAADMQPTGLFPWDGKAHVDFPASSPLVLSCGATRIDLSGTTLAGEAVWNQGFAGSRGEQLRFGRWRHQRCLHPATVVAGEPHIARLGERRAPGTRSARCHRRWGPGFRAISSASMARTPSPVGPSAVAPLWAGLITRINQILGKPVGFVNATLYAYPNAFNDITLGSNRVSSSRRKREPRVRCHQGLGRLYRPGQPNRYCRAGRPPVRRRKSSVTCLSAVTTEKNGCPDFKESPALISGWPSLCGSLEGTPWASGRVAASTHPTGASRTSF